MFYVLFIFLVLACVFDIREKRIPNILTFGGIVLGLILNIINGGSTGLLESWKGIGTGFLVWFPIYLLGGIGGGDVKLWMAVGAITGSVFTIYATTWGIFANMAGVLFVLFSKKIFLKSIIISYQYLKAYFRRLIFRAGEFPAIPKGPVIPATPFFAAGIALAVFFRN